MTVSRQFEITPSNVKARIDSIDVNILTGKAVVRFSLNEPRNQPAALHSAQYKLSGGAWTEMELSADGYVRDQAISTVGDDWLTYILIWEAPTDLALTLHEDVETRFQFKDDEDTLDDYATYDLLNLEFTPIIEEFLKPQEFTKDTTPTFEFVVPSAYLPCNMHFEIIVCTDEEMTDVVTTINSSDDESGWWIYHRGTWVEMKDLGCPNAAALENGKCKFEPTAELDQGVYWHTITVVDAVKKVASGEITETPAEMHGYPFNY